MKVICNIPDNFFKKLMEHMNLKGQLQGHTVMLAARQERSKRGGQKVVVEKSC